MPDRLAIVAGHAVRDWRRAEGGTVALLFALLALPVIGIVSVAIDFGRASQIRGTLETAALAAAQAASARLGADRSEVEQEAKRLLQANLPKPLHDTPFKLVIGPNATSVEIAIATQVPTTLMGIVGVGALEVEATGFARRPKLPTIEVAPVGVDGSAAPTVPTVPAGPGRLHRGREGLPGLPSGSGAHTMPPPGSAPDPARVRQEVEAVLKKLGVRHGPGGVVEVDPARLEQMMRELRSLHQRR